MERNKLIVNVALIGNGYWGNILKKYVRDNKNFNIKRICNSKTDLSEVWNDDDIEAVIIATPNSTHFSLCESALDSNKHILIEKPLAMSCNGANVLKSLANANNKVLLTDYVMTYSRGLRRIIDDAKNGKYGNILGMSMEIKRLGRFGRDNVYVLLGSHLLSVLSMFDDLNNFEFKRNDIVVFNDNVETGCILFRNLFNGISGEISVGMNSKLKNTKVEIYCEDGTLLFNPINPLSSSAIKYDRIKWNYEGMINSDFGYAYDESNNLKYVIDHFYDCINKKSKDNSNMSVNVVDILREIGAL